MCDKLRIPLFSIAALLWLFLATPRVSAQSWDPSVVIAAYSAALNAHDLPAALDLFDQYGSATDIHGRHFEGSEGLTEFLLGSGFGTSDAQITTEGLHVVGNRAVWTYSCSCAPGATEVRMVVNHHKITVFAVVPPPAAPLPRRANTEVPRWWIGFVVVAGLATGFGARRIGSASPIGRASQGRLLRGLARARQRQTRS